MSNAFDLNIHDVNAAIDADYGNYKINTAKPGEPEDLACFFYYLRVSVEARQKLADAFERLRVANVQAEDEDPDAPADGIDAITRVIKEAMEALAVSPDDYAKLERVVGNDLPTWAFILKSYAARYRGDTGKA